MASPASTATMAARMASPASTAAVATSMASPASTHATTIWSISRTGTGDGYGAAEELAYNRAAVPFSRHLWRASLLHGAYCQWHLSIAYLRGLWHLDAH